MKQTRNTKQKEIIKNIITNADGHYSADEIYQMALKVDNNIGRATVFRNLKALAENNEIGYLQMIDGPDCYESLKEPHYHFKCKKCKIQNVGIITKKFNQILWITISSDYMIKFIGKQKTSVPSGPSE